MFIAIDVSVVERSEDGLTVTLQVHMPQSPTSVFGRMAADASGAIKLTLPPGVRLAPGDIVNGYVRRSD